MSTRPSLVAGTFGRRRAQAIVTDRGRRLHRRLDVAGKQILDAVSAFGTSAAGVPMAVKNCPLGWAFWDDCE